MTVTILLDMPWCELTVDELWPDGDAPDVITETEVRHVLEECGYDQVSDWFGDLSDMTVTICGDDT